jgi:hypothetical protein
MPYGATLLRSSRSNSSDLRLAQIVEFLGLEWESASALIPAGSPNPASDISAANGSCLLASADTMAEVFANDNLPVATDALLGRAGFLFVYGFSPQKAHGMLAAQLTGGIISSVSSFGSADLKYQVASSRPDITREFSGLSFGPIQNRTDYGFVLSRTPSEFSALIDIGGLPLYGMLRRGECTVFLLASEVADINQRIDHALPVTEYFSRLLPPMMFLKYAFKEKCWHSRKRFANFIIDDPPLKRSYGFLNYRQLLEKTADSRFAATVAFIPWNYKRTDKSTPQLFLDHPDRLSICVHGCDHTQSEFADTDPDTLNAKIRMATDRMQALQALTGLTYADVMVFPQGEFSSQSLKILKANNYLAAVNTGAIPSDLKDHHDLVIADFLHPAITRFESFPLFIRRYPGKLVNFASDLFFDKPLLVAEHHRYFKGDCRELVEFIHKINALCPQLEWRQLGEILRRSYLEKTESSQVAECRIYTNHQIIENTDNLPRKFVVTKDESGHLPIEKVLVNSEATPFTMEGNVLRLSVEVPAGDLTAIRIIYRNDLPYVANPNGLAIAAKVRVRRVLSEFRDNYLSRNDRLLSLAYRMKRRFS